MYGPRGFGGGAIASIRSISSSMLHRWSLTPAAIAETNYADKTVTPGVRYVYVVVAIDKASPPNRSGQSPRYEVTAR